MNTQRKVIVSNITGSIIVGDYSPDNDYGENGFLLENGAYLKLISDNFNDLEMDIMCNETTHIRVIPLWPPYVRFSKNINQYIVLDAPDDWAKI